MLDERRGRTRTNLSEALRNARDRGPPTTRAKANAKRNASPQASPKGSSPAFLALTPVKNEATADEALGGTPEHSPVVEAEVEAPEHPPAANREEEHVVSEARAPSTEPTEANASSAADTGEIPHVGSPSSPHTKM